MNIKDVENLAELARIELSPDEKKSLLSDMQGILDYVKVIASVEAPTRAGGETAELKHELHNVWREDTIEPRQFSSELIIGQFPDSQDGFLKVKKIL